MMEEEEDARGDGAWENGGGRVGGERGRWWEAWGWGRGRR
jgi:hypothetical protein